LLFVINVASEDSLFPRIVGVFRFKLVQVNSYSEQLVSFIYIVEMRR